MKRLLLTLLATSLAVILAACGGSETEEKSIDNVETDTTEENESEETNDDSNGDGDNNEQTFDEVIVDNENIKATLISVVEEKDDIWGDSIEVTFEVENKREDTIEVQAREVSADGKMIDESLLAMSTEVAAGKVADAKLTIQAFDDQELPPMEENLELKLHIFSWDDIDYSEDHPVVIEFK